MLSVFAKVVLGQSVKSRLQQRLSRQEAESFHVACLADTLETAATLGEPLCLFLQGGDAPRAVEDLANRLADTGLPPELWTQLEVHPQTGADLGERMENAIAQILSGEPRPCLLVGCDHPSLPASALRHALDRLGQAADRLLTATLQETQSAVVVPDLVLGPTADGGYWCIGCVRPIPGLLHGITWSSASTLDQTRSRAALRNLRVELLQPWTDVDVPEDLPRLAGQIAACRTRGDPRTARHTELFLRRIDGLRS